MFKRILFIASISAILLFVGCVKEDNDDCPNGISLKFSYKFDEQGQSTITSRIGMLRLYVFDQNRVLHHIMPISTSSLVNGSIKADIEPGTYTFIALGFSGKDMIAGGYLDAEVTDPATHTYTTPATVGTTTLDNFRVKLKSTQSGGLWSPSANNFDNLFTATVENTTIISTNKEQVVNLSFVNNCSILDTTVEGIDVITTRATSPVKVFFEGKYGTYNYKGEIDNAAPSLRFAPPYKSLTSRIITTDIKTLRLDKAYYTANPVYLHITKTSNGTDVIAPLNVMDIILKLKDNGGKLIFQTQNDIDKAGTFTFKIYLSFDLGVSITVNGFKVEGLNAGLM